MTPRALFDSKTIKFEKGKPWVTRGRKATDPGKSRDGGAAGEITRYYLACPLTLRAGFFLAGQGETVNKKIQRKIL